MDLPDFPDPPRRITLPMDEQTFRRWVRAQEKVRAEWIDGQAIIHPFATFEHNKLVMWLLTLITLFVEREKLGFACFDTEMRIATGRPRRLLPDAYFVAESRRHLMDADTIHGPVDLAVEVVSPDSAAADYQIKYHEYARASVREYRIIDPQYRAVFFHRLTNGGTFEPVAPDADGKLHSAALPGLWVRPADLWQSPRPDVVAVLAEVNAAAPV